MIVNSRTTVNDYSYNKGRKPHQKPKQPESQHLRRVWRESLFAFGDEAIHRLPGVIIYADEA